MSHRLDQTFERLREEGKKAFVAYVCAGDPDLDRSLEVIEALAEEGADVIELGVPFSDPMADGIVNQMAAERALLAGMTLPKVLELISRFRERWDTPIVLFTYLNPLYAFGFSAFLLTATEAGADGILLLDLPPDEAPWNEEFGGEIPLAPIRLVAPTTPDDRLDTILSGAKGFIYAVSRTGVTGAHHAPAANIADLIERIGQHCDLPVCIGFGITTADQAAEIAAHADGVVVGSAIVKIIEEYRDSPELIAKLRNFVRPLIEATHKAGK